MTDPPALVGQWVPADEATRNACGEVTMTFQPDGRLTYAIENDDTIEVIYLTYEVSGDMLATDQPSSPQLERTRFEIDEAGRLRLYYESEASVFRRA
ncbi:MAG TPA: hypothetical protein VGO92_04310 [Acidimicrobiales bacterium]|jgi:hypothetical protein|nr:hypothetical protein [Acidimicrobiales bacterium]